MDTAITERMQKVEGALYRISCQLQELTEKVEKLDENLTRAIGPNTGVNEVSPGPVCSWNRNEEKTHCLNQIPHCALYPFIGITRNTRNFYLINIENFGTGVIFYFKGFYISYVPTCPYKGKVTIKGKYLCVSNVFYEFTTYLKNSKFTRDGWGSTFQQNLGIADYNFCRFILATRWHQNW